MTRRSMTIVILALTVASLVAWDCYAICTAGVGASISDVILSASLHYPALPFLAGFLCGHLFAPQLTVSK